MSKLSVVIVNYNTKEILRDCLKNLEGIYPAMEIIVVDNASPDESAQMVEQEFPAVILVKCAGNYGLAKGSNLGLGKATGDYVLYLGTDAFPHKDTVAGMIEYMSSSKSVGVATCKLVLRSGKLDMDAHRGFPTPWASLTHFLGFSRLFPLSKFFNQYFLGYKDMRFPHEIDLCISHFMLIKRSVFAKIGKWDEDFFIYGEDVDFCYRVKEAGFRIMYLPQWSAIHYKGASVGIRKETCDLKNAKNLTHEQKRQRYLETTRSMKLFYKKHYNDKYNPLISRFVLMGIQFLEWLRTW